METSSKTNTENSFPYVPQSVIEFLIVAHVTSILDYIKESVHFKKYNRIAYAYRVEQVPVVFITEKKDIQSQYYEDAFSDETIQGSGQKLLHLLEKFNVKNVFICCLIQQYNPLMPFETTNYRAIVENSRLLLDELYKKVVNLKDKFDDNNKSLKDLLLKDTKTVKLKKCNVNDALSEEVLMKEASKKEIIVERPNHIYKKGKPKFLTKPAGSTDTTAYEIKCMWERCKTMRGKFAQIKGSLEDKQIEQLRYFVMYDKNPLINSVIRLFVLFENISKEELTQDYQFEKVREMDFDVLGKERLQKCDEMLKSHRKLNVDSIMKVNRAMGMLFSMMDLKIRFSKTFNRIAELMKKNGAKDEDGEISQITQESNKIEIKMNPRQQTVESAENKNKLSA